MIYEQSNTFRKFAEIFGAVFAITILLLIQQQPAPGLEDLLWSMVIVLISLRYGVYYGAVPFLWAIGFFVFQTYASNQDVLIVISDSLFFIKLALYFFLLLFCGLYSLSQKERYTDLQHIYEEMKDEKEEVEKTLQQVLGLHEKYKDRILHTENSYEVIFDMIEQLNHTDPEIIQDEAIKVIRKHFEAKKVILYYISRQGNTLRVKLRWGSFEEEAASILLADAPSLLKRTLQMGSVQFRQPDDDSASPAIAGPIFVGGSLRYIAAVDEPAFEKLSPQEIQWFTWCLRWAGDRLTFAYRYEREVYKNDRYQGTGIYKMEAFFHRLSVEIDRMKQLGQPFASFDLEVGQANLKEMDFILQGHLRETDLTGFDEHSGKLYILLPVTSKSYIETIKERLLHALSLKGGEEK
ncbi:hypothetical protein LRR81_16045 [Metabacillus sp. GX 13764]|uniref:hypothetical protein n=1 Tax=Metabacillus kandeliae TaxID=2900151 RepID=UPI001E54B426|nr:hypothetical protein [Metabacillus kandeliae]MCD7035756.1 hypothetical protein [Metabacillus kandeliae]